jgi:succinate-semialdehyde dehydrogenase / glutarate-semialdehyde dehydrogenase
MSTPSVSALPGITTINPATGEELATYPATGAAGIDDATATSAAAQQDWAALDLAGRGEVLRAAAAVLRRRQCLLVVRGAAGTVANWRRAVSENSSMPAPSS